MRHIVSCIIQYEDRFLLRESDTHKDHWELPEFEKDPDVYEVGMLLRYLHSRAHLYEKSFDFIMIGKRLAWDATKEEAILLFEYYIYNINQDVLLEEEPNFRLFTPAHMYLLKTQGKLSESAYSILPLYRAFDTFLSSWESIH